MGNNKFEFVTLALLYDVNVFSGTLGSLNSVGVFYNNGTAKKSWYIVKNLTFT
jgi:hypothetical protein